jgi:hypothetical protein
MSEMLDNVFSQLNAQEDCNMLHNFLGALLEAQIDTHQFSTGTLNGAAKSIK